MVGGVVEFEPLSIVMLIQSLQYLGGRLKLSKRIEKDQKWF